MRIVGGQWRGRPIQAPSGQGTRPTTDRVRETLFNILTHAPWALTGDGAPLFENKVVLDAFAGSGAIGLEALSRGARVGLFFEKDQKASACLRANLSALGLKKPHVWTGRDALRPPALPSDYGTAALAIFDPPYDKGLLAPALGAFIQAGWLTDGAILAVESDARREEMLPLPDETALEPLDRRVIGQTSLRFARLYLSGGGG